jgi:hypothetical protein
VVTYEIDPWTALGDGTRRTIFERLEDIDPSTVRTVIWREEEKMFSNRLVKLLLIFTMVSIGFGIVVTFYPQIRDSGAGWVFGTAISTFGGIFYGWRAEGRSAALRGGALIGGISIAVGTLVAYMIGTLPAISGVIGATLVGVVSGAVAGFVARWVASFPRFARA